MKKTINIILWSLCWLLLPIAGLFTAVAVMPEHVDPPYNRDQHLPKHMMDRGNDVE